MMNTELMESPLPQMSSYSCCLKKKNEDNICRELIHLLLENVLRRSAEKSNVFCHPDREQILHKHLFNQVWAKLQEQYFDVSRKDWTQLNKNIFTRLCKELSLDKESVLTLLCLENLDFEMFLLRFCRETFEEMEKNKKFLSSVGKTVCTPFRKLQIFQKNI